MLFFQKSDCRVTGIPVYLLDRVVFKSILFFKKCITLKSSREIQQNFFESQDENLSIICREMLSRFFWERNWNHICGWLDTDSDWDYFLSFITWFWKCDLSFSVIFVFHLFSYKEMIFSGKYWHFINHLQTTIV